MKITKEILDNLRGTQQKSHYGSEAKSMFVNGVFNPDNWNGGDGIIRRYFTWFIDRGMYLSEPIGLIDYINFTHDNIHYWGNVIINYSIYEEQHYATITFSGQREINGETELDKYEHVAYFSWYKSRGTTESARFDGQLMTEDQYLFVLNALQETGFDFDLR